MLTLYDAPRCPFCARVRIVIAEKGVAHERVEVDLSDRPGWLLELNPPSGLVPVLVDDGVVLPESWALMEYIEERFPEPQLMPRDSAGRARVRGAVEHSEGLRSAYYALRRARDAGTEERFESKLRDLERILGARTFLAGEDYTLADIAVLPWLARAEVYFGLDLSERDLLGEWLDRLAERPAIASELGLVRSLAPSR